MMVRRRLHAAAPPKAPTKKIRLDWSDVILFASAYKKGKGFNGVMRRKDRWNIEER